MDDLGGKTHYFRKHPDKPWKGSSKTIGKKLGTSRKVESYLYLNHLPSGKLTLQWNTTIFHRIYIFKWWISHGYVTLPEDKIWVAILLMVGLTSRVFWMFLKGFRSRDDGIIFRWVKCWAIYQVAVVHLPPAPPFFVRYRQEKGWIKYISFSWLVHQPHSRNIPGIPPQK